jgi:hypothetical protein
MLILVHNWSYSSPSHRSIKKSQESHMELTNKLKWEIKDSNPQPQPTILAQNWIYFLPDAIGVFNSEGTKGRDDTRSMKLEIRFATTPTPTTYYCSHSCEISLCNKTDWRTYKNLFGLGERKHSRICFSFTASWKLEAIKELNYSQPPPQRTYTALLRSRNNRLLLSW